LFKIFFLSFKEYKESEGVAQEVECLISKHEVLSSNPRTDKIRKKEDKGCYLGWLPFILVSYKAYGPRNLSVALANSLQKAFITR
jgi:hypothetical protein